MKRKKKEKLLSLLLDSSLISQSKRFVYDTKIVVCGDYIQLYTFKKRVKNDNNLEELDFSVKTNDQLKYDKIKKHKLDELCLYKETNKKSRDKPKVIAYKNILRSKFQMERVIKSNEKEFNIFITLTFSDNVKDISYANKKFNIWKTYIKQLKKDFKYVCVPEYQKRGAVHYHLLTNLDINKDLNIIIPQKENNIILKNRYDVKGWSYGFSRVDKLNDIKVISYLAKYMTKKSDDRLYSKHRFFYSQNLNKPYESFLNSNNVSHLKYLNKCIKNTDLVYSNQYLDYFNNDVMFFEYKKST